MSLEISEVSLEVEGEGIWQCQRCLATFQQRSGLLGPYFFEEEPERSLCGSCTRGILNGVPAKRVHEELEEMGLWPLPKRVGGE